MKGFISQSDEDSVTLTESKTRQTTSMAYSKVSKLKGSGLSTAAKIGIGAGIGVLATGVVIGVMVANTDFGVW